MTKYTPKYLNGKGKYQRRYSILWSKYLKADSIRTGNVEASKALRRLKSFIEKYHRFYNNDDTFTFEGRRFVPRRAVRVFEGRPPRAVRIFEGPTETQMKELDKIADRLILDAWRKTNGGTLPLKG